jgi:hypothetical protein
MVDLPIPDDAPVLAQAPSQRYFGNSGSFLAASLDKLSEGLEAVATRAAERQASDDLRAAPVTRDAQGNIVVPQQQGLPILGAAGLHYEAAIKAGALAQGSNLAQQDITSIAAQHQNDPQGLLRAGQSYIANIRARNSGPLGETMAQRASDMLTQHYDGAVLQHAANDTEQAKQALVTTRSNAFNTLSALAQQGKGVGDPAYDKANAEYLAAGASIASNPKFGVSAKVMAQNDAAGIETLRGYQVSSHVDEWIKTPGVGIQGAVKNLSEAVNDPKLNLSVAERHQMFALGEARIHLFQAENAADIQGMHGAVEAVDSDVRNFKSPPPPPEILSAMHEKAVALGDVTSAKQVEALQIWVKGQSARQWQTPEQQLHSQVIGPQAATDAAPSKPARGNNPGNIVDGDWARSQPGYVGANGRFAQFDSMASGTAAMSKNLGSYARQGITTLNALTAKWAPAGDGANNPAAYAATISKATGIDPNATIDLSDPATQAKIIPAMARVEQGHAVSGLSTGVAARSANGFPFTAEQVKANPFLVAVGVHAQAADAANRFSFGEKLGQTIMQRYENGFAAPLEDYAMFMQLASGPGGQRLGEMATKLQATHDAYVNVHGDNGLINMEPGQASVALGVARNMASNSPDMYHTMLAEQTKKMYDAEVKMRSDDPVAYAVGKGWAKPPAALDVNNRDALIIGAYQRGAAMDRLGENGAVSLTASVFGKADTEYLKNAISSGTGEQVQNIISAISQVPPARRAATIAALGPAIMGAANSGEIGKMRAAYGFLDQEFKTNPVTFRKDFGAPAANQLLAYRNAIAFLPPDVAAKRVQGWSDPAQEETRKGVYSIANDEAKKITADQVAQKWSTFSYLNPLSWNGVRAATPTTDAAATSAEGLHADYMQAYIFQRQLGMDAAHADANAVQTLSTKWGVSGVNGDMVMQYPPEARYPPIGGSHSWIADQLDKDVLQASGADKAQALLAKQGTAFLSPQLPADGGFTVEDRNAAAVYHAPRAIAADATTEAEIHAGKPPSYYIVTKDDKGLWNPLTDPSGKLVRFRPDPAKVPSVAATHAPGFETGGGGWHGAGPDDMTALPDTTQGP